MNKKYLAFLVATFAAFSHADQYILNVPANGVAGYSIEGITFSANKSTITLGDAITVSWSITGNPASLSISGYGPVTGKTGSVTFVPEQVSSIVLTAVANSATQTKTIPLTVNQYSIGTLTFTADKTQITPGEPLVLTWSTTGQPKTVVIEGIGTVANTGSQTIYPTTSGNINMTVSDGTTIQTKSVPLTVVSNSSCNNLHISNPSLTSGIYSLKVNGNTFSAYCYIDATGGWTMIGAQYESNPVVWTGNTVNYDPSLTSLKSFTLPTTMIPQHTGFAVGKDNSILYKTTNFSYTTGDLPRTVVSDTGGAEYVLYRSLSNFYNFHNPDSTLSSSTWNNSLTFELHRASTANGGALSTTNDFTWTFAPNRSTASERGYAISGLDLGSTSQLYAWTIWVK